MKKDIIFIGSMDDKDEKYLVSDLALPSINMQKRIIEELDEYENIDIHAISVLPVVVYPVCKLINIKQRKIQVTDRTNGIQIGIKNKGLPTQKIEENGVFILKPRIGNIQKTKIIEKEISTVNVRGILIQAIKKYMGDIKFGLILYCTYSITFLSAIEYVKKRDDTKTYLPMKDIFSQNAVDIGMMSKNEIKGLLYKHFKRQSYIEYLTEVTA